MSREWQTPEKDGTDASLAGSAPPRERRPFGGPGMRAIARAASHIAKPIIAGQGGGTLARLKAEWTSIIGPDFAAITWPEAVGRDGGLKLRVVPMRALEVQHRMPLIIDRINTFFGRPVAARLMLVQGAMPISPSPPRPPDRPLSAADSAHLAARLAEVDDPELRDRLDRLGRAIIAATDPDN